MIEGLDTELRKALAKCVKEIDSFLHKEDITDTCEQKDMYLSAGGVTFKLQFVPGSEVKDINETIKEDLRNKVNEKIKEIINFVNKKLNEATSMIVVAKNEFEVKEAKLRKEMEQLVSMPDISYQNALNGLSVAKGQDRGTLTWIYQAIYAPKFVNESKINENFAKKLLTPIRIFIKTRGDAILEVSTKKLISGDKFEHYHQSSPDCWGDWRPSSIRWKTSNDILRVAKEAEAILERINEYSLAIHTPEGLPRFSTILNNMSREKYVESAKKTSVDTRLGRVEANQDEQVWDTVAF